MLIIIELGDPLIFLFCHKKVSATAREPLKSDWHAIEHRLCPNLHNEE